MCLAEPSTNGNKIHLNVSSLILRKVKRINETSTGVQFKPYQFGLEPVPVKNLVKLQSREDLEQFVVGSDIDIGGKSTVKLDLDEEGFGALDLSLA